MLSAMEHVMQLANCRGNGVGPFEAECGVDQNAEEAREQRGERFLLHLAADLGADLVDFEPSPKLGLRKNSPSQGSSVALASPCCSSVLDESAWEASRLGDRAHTAENA